MIALPDPLQHEKFQNEKFQKDETNKKAKSSVSSKLHVPKSAVLAVHKAMRALLYSSTNRLVHANAARKERKQDKLALERLLQLDDALLKDMGIERRDLEAVKAGALTLDALNKFGIVSARDNSSNTHFIWK